LALRFREWRTVEKWGDRLRSPVWLALRFREWRTEEKWGDRLRSPPAALSLRFRFSRKALRCDPVLAPPCWRASSRGPARASAVGLLGRCSESAEEEEVGEDDEDGDDDDDRGREGLADFFGDGGGHLAGVGPLVLDLGRGFGRHG
jgi:hypothetical protein